MNNVLSKYSELFDKVYSYALFLLLFFPILPINLSSYVIGFVVGLSLFGLLFKSDKKPAIRIEKPWIITLSFLVLAISLIYTQNIHEGLFQLEKRGVLILFPIIFLLRRNRISVKVRDSFEFIFILITFIFFTYLNIKIIFDLNSAIDRGLLQGTWVQVVTSNDFYYLYRTYFEKISNLHPTYASIYALFSSGILIIRLLESEKKITTRKIILICVITLLFLYSLILAAKGPLLAFLISVLIILFLKLRRIQFFAISLGMIILFIASLFFVPTIKNRASELFAKSDGKEISSVSIREIVYTSAVELIKENWLIGVGVGDVQDQLNKKYELFQEEKLTINSLNTHNEYFNLWLSAGLIGILSLLFTLIIPFRDSLKKGDLNFLFFLAFMSLCLIFENLLSRQKGALFFTLFYLIYYYYQMDNKKCQHDIQNI